MYKKIGDPLFLWMNITTESVPASAVPYLGGWGGVPIDLFLYYLFVKNVPNISILVYLYQICVISVPNYVISVPNYVISVSNMSYLYRICHIRSGFLKSYTLYSTGSQKRTELTELTDRLNWSTNQNVQSLFVLSINNAIVGVIVRVV